MSSSPHMRWRNAIKERMKTILQSLLSLSQTSCGSVHRPCIQLESKDECYVMANLFYSYNTNGGPFKTSPLGRSNDYTLFLNKDRPIEHADIHVLLVHVDVLFDHLWTYTTLTDSGVVDCTADEISDHKWRVYHACTRAYTHGGNHPKLLPPTFVRRHSDFIVDLRCIPDIDTRRQVCPFIE